MTSPIDWDVSESEGQIIATNRKTGQTFTGTIAAFNAILGYKSVDLDSYPAKAYFPVTKADEDLTNGPCRALLVGTAGTLNITQIDGTARTNVPVVAGYNPIACLQVNLGGTATDIWALY